MPMFNNGLFGLWDDLFSFMSWATAAPRPDPASDPQTCPSAPAPVQTAAVGDLGTIPELSRGAGSGGSGNSGGASASGGTTVVTSAGSALVIDLSWDSSVASAPAGFKPDMIAAAEYIESQISSAVTINLDVGFDEIAGTSLQNGALGESETNIQSVSYASLVAALNATASNDATDAALLASLPATAPVSGNWWVTTAQAKALGLAAANGTGLDGDIGFGSATEFTFGLTNAGGTVSPNTYDFFATAVHELTETMGRLLLVGETINRARGYSLMDLEHYSAPGVRDFTQSTPGYFSPNGGTANLGAYNTISGGDPGDWASSVLDDSFDAYATPGVAETVSGNDIAEMDAIGWNLTGSGVPAPSPPPSPPPPSPPVVSDQTPAKSWTEGQNISLTLPSDTFTDPQGESLRYAASQANGQPLPAWLTFNATTETFSGTAPATAQTISLKVTATDTSGLAASETFSASVVAPVVRPSIKVTDQTPSQTWTDGTSLDLVLPSNTFTDALGLKMTFAAYEVGGTNITSWLRFNPATDTFSGNVPANQKGTALLEVVAQDSAHATAADLFAVTFVAGSAAHFAALGAPAAWAASNFYGYLNAAAPPVMHP